MDDNILDQKGSAGSLLRFNPNCPHYENGKTNHRSGDNEQRKILFCLLIFTCSHFARNNGLSDSHRGRACVLRTE